MSLDGVVEKAAQEIVRERVRAAVAEALAREPGALVQRIVDVALAARENSYDRETLLERTIRQMITEEVKAAFEEWVEEHRAAIRRAVAARLRATKDGLLDRLADRVLEGLRSDFHVSFRVQLDD